MDSPAFQRGQCSCLCLYVEGTSARLWDLFLFSALAALQGLVERTPETFPSPSVCWQASNMPLAVVCFGLSRLRDPIFPNSLR